MGRYDIAYLLCPFCRSVQTEPPYWLGEAYSTALVAADVGAVQRNLELAERIAAIIHAVSDPGGRFLDYGGGHGLLVRLMRDRGFDFSWSDQYASNDYALGFEAAPEDRGFTLATAFEVAEHLVDPLPVFDDLLARSEAVLFSTELLPDPIPAPRDWWYYVLSGGQHVTLYSLDTLRWLADTLGVSLATNGRSLHLLSKTPVSQRRFRAVARLRVARVLNRLHRRPSLQSQDFARLTASPRSPTSTPSR